VLIAAIRNNGSCLCPRCLVQKSAASKMGSVPDMRLRVVKRRFVNNRYRDKIAQARSLIYSNGRVVQSTLVEELLKPESYVPTLVSDDLNSLDQASYCEFRTHSLVDWETTSIFFPLWSSINSTKLSLVCGRQSSSTSSVCSMSVVLVQ
jgi:hypothetical protein